MDEKYKQNFIKAGELARQVRLFGKALIKTGASYNAIISKIKQKILELGGIEAFPPQIALNDVAAHFLPNPNEDILFSNEVVKLDIGVCYKGAIGDCAVTVDLSGKNADLIGAAEEALLRAEEIVKVGLPIREIGKVIESTIISYGFSPIRNLSGHGLGFYKIHTPPSIPNWDDHSKAIVKPGMTFAIEPFATNGKGVIYESGEPTIFSFIKQVPLKNPISRQLLNKIKTFSGLPFSLHDIIISESLSETKNSLKELVEAGAVIGYSPLIEQAHGMVAQAENSVLVDKNGVVIITTR
jgi:methionyl aminopeptidase